MSASEEGPTSKYSRFEALSTTSVFLWLATLDFRLSFKPFHSSKLI
jgi:hypothetical protein